MHIGRSRGSGQANCRDSLENLLIDNYESTKAFYLRLPDDAARAAYIDLFEGRLSEAQFLKSSSMVAMALFAVDDESQLERIYAQF